MKVNQIFKAVEDITGVDRDTIVSGSRIREHYFARMIVAHHLWCAGYTHMEIRVMLRYESNAAILRILNQYYDEQTPYYVFCKNEVDDLLTKKTNNV